MKPRQRAAWAFTFDGAMVDAPHLSRAKALVARAEAIAAVQ